MNKNEVQAMEQQPGLITPAGSLDQTVEQFRIYQQMKNKLGTRDDFQAIRTKEGVKNHPKKSFVRKVQRFFNLSCEIVQDEPLRDSDGNVIAWLAKARAIHLGTGAFQEADGSCAFDEKVDKRGELDPKRATIHNIRSHAVTRAKNRAILDLVGFGEVSAEEMTDNEYDVPQQSQQWKSNGDAKATEKQISKIHVVANKKGLDKSEVKQLIRYLSKGEKESTKDLKRDQASYIIDLMEKTDVEEIRKMISPVAAVIENHVPTDEDLKELDSV
ncbi:hypothetical protein [Melghirimyces algeriensis]|uniref:Uncharacterized protein n=1 Tax=Melghirimyces algeriensis TaxID=910412 RepID=A0A521C4Y0_9BACL|nr:hypothetical protein [Melghirimyces algeriensis]SMO54453.1 hypothetical protein SAMN06264849_103129 [Melghirimyces algeriensis]